VPKSLRRSRRAAAPAAAALLAAAALALAGCAARRPPSAGPAPSPEAVFRSLLGRNPGLSSVRAVAEASISFAAREVTLPGVLALDALGGFRLELLDPLDRPLAIVFAEEGRVVQYRPSQGLASSLAVFPADCRGVDPADWVSAIVGSSLAPVAGERLADRALWGADRSLERSRGDELRQSVRYRGGGGNPRPSSISWYCGEEPVLQLRVREWIASGAWELPSRFEIEYPKAGLAVRIELREIEGNPPPTGQPFRPRLGPEIGWSSWNLPR
jgi:hypothetical protein